METRYFVDYPSDTKTTLCQQEDSEQKGRPHTIGDQVSRDVKPASSEKGTGSNTSLPSELDSAPVMDLECEDHGPLMIPNRPRFRPQSDNRGEAETGSTAAQVSESRPGPSGSVVETDSSKNKRQLDLVELYKEAVSEKSRNQEKAPVTTEAKRRPQRTAKTPQDTPTSSSRRITRSSTLSSDSKSNRRGKQMTQQGGKSPQLSARKPQAMKERSSRKKKQDGKEIAVDSGKRGAPVKKTKTQSGQKRQEATNKSARQKTKAVPVRGSHVATKTAVQSGKVLRTRKRTKRGSEETVSKKSEGLRQRSQKKKTPSNLNSSPDCDVGGDAMSDDANEQGGGRKKRKKGSVSYKEFFTDDGSQSDESASDGDPYSSTEEEPAGSNHNKARKKKKKLTKNTKTQERHKCDHCSYTGASKFEVTAHISRDHGLAVENWTPRRPRGNRIQLRCAHCTYTSEKSPVLYSHTLKVHKGSSAVCVSCSFTGNSLKEMLQHEDEKHPRCKIARCRFKTDNPEELAEHLKIHMRDGRFKCPECNKMFCRKREYIHHAAQAHENKTARGETDTPTIRKYKKLMKETGFADPNEKNFKCDQCDFRTAVIHRLKTHILCKHTKKEELQYACTICDHRAPYKSWLDFHMQQKHQGVRKYEFPIYKCEECEYQSRARKQLQIHRLKKHGLGEGPEKCEHCDFTATYKSQLAVHLKDDHNIVIQRCSYCRRYWGTEEALETHHDTCKYKGEFPCEECDFVATSKLKFQTHMNFTHGKGTTHELCHQCGKIFYGAFKYEQHLLTHLEEKPFKCPYESCKYATIHKFNMPAHLLTHTGEKPYKCTTCSYSCVQKSNLKSHMKKKHCTQEKTRKRDREISKGRKKRGKKEKLQSCSRLEEQEEDEAAAATQQVTESEEDCQLMETPAAVGAGGDEDTSRWFPDADEDRVDEGETDTEEVVDFSVSVQDQGLTEMGTDE